MVSNQKIKFFVKRVEQIKDRKTDEIKGKYPEVRTDYVSLIVAGQGRMKSEQEIRELVGNVSRYSCPATIEVLRLFEFNGERKVAEKAEAERREKMNAEIAAFNVKVKAAMDLVYFGKDEELKTALDELEAYGVNEAKAA